MHTRVWWATRSGPFDSLTFFYILMVLLLHTCTLDGYLLKGMDIKYSYSIIHPNKKVL